MMLEWQRFGDHNGDLPERETVGSAGYDLYTTMQIDLWPGESKTVPTGWGVAIPSGYVGLIRPRSGVAVRNFLEIGAGVIDSDYRGEILLRLISVAREGSCWTIEPYARVAQLLVVPHLALRSAEVRKLPTTVRGDSGFGSTGEK
jgi:dUTP pyrophosphatase